MKKLSEIINSCRRAEARACKKLYEKMMVEFSEKNIEKVSIRYPETNEDKDKQNMAINETIIAKNYIAILFDESENVYKDVYIKAVKNNLYELTIICQPCYGFPYSPEMEVSGEHLYSMEILYEFLENELHRSKGVVEKLNLNDEEKEED